MIIKKLTALLFALIYSSEFLFCLPFQSCPNCLQSELCKVRSSILNFEFDGKKIIEMCEIKASVLWAVEHYFDQKDQILTLSNGIHTLIIGLSFIL